MRLFGLTGGIASGKSTVARMFQALGDGVIDADALAREVVEPGRPALAKVAARWPNCVRPDGRLDRAALGARVFEHPEERLELEAILHPAIQEAAHARTLAVEAAGKPYAIYEAALVFEKDLDAGLDGVILVAASPETQIQRMRERDGLDGREARRRLDAQLPLDEKRRRARWIVDGDVPLEETRRQVEAVHRALEEASR